MFKSILIFLLMFLMSSILILTSCTSKKVDDISDAEINDAMDTLDDDGVEDLDEEGLVGGEEGEDEEDFAEGDEDFAEGDEEDFAEGDEDFAEGDEEDFAEGDEDFAEGDEEDFAEGDEDFAEGDEEDFAEGDEDFDDFDDEDFGEGDKATVAENNTGGNNSGEKEALDEYGGEDVAGGEVDQTTVTDVETPESVLLVSEEEEEFFGETGDAEDIGGTPLPSEKSWVPVKKIVQAPFHKNGGLVNTVYLARPGDTLDSVSMKIYGIKSRSKELLQVNSTLVKGLKVGDKVYYNSPHRPSDSQQLLVYYEDVNSVPQTYVSKSGDNIRQVSMQLLGDEGSWKEVWATNLHVDSKGQLPEGTELKYWSDANVATAVPQISEEVVIQNEPVDVLPPPPSLPQGAEAAMGFPPPLPETAAESTASLPPPLPEAGLNNPTIPTKAGGGTPTAEKTGSTASFTPPPSLGGLDSEPLTTDKPQKDPASTKDKGSNLWLGLGAMVIFAAVLLIIIRRKKARQNLEFNTSMTHLSNNKLSSNKGPAV